MAYTNRNLLQRIIDIQNIYLKYSMEGVTGEFIYQKHIYPIYRISRTTFYAYLARNAKKEMTDIIAQEEAEKAKSEDQLNLFSN